MNDDTDVPLSSRRVRGGFLLLWIPALVGCFVPVALGLSPARAVLALGSAVTRPVVADFIYLDRPTQILLLALALGSCSPLLAIPWRLAFGWRAPASPVTLRAGRVLVGALATTNALAVAMLVLGSVQRDASMLLPLVGELAGFALLATLALPGRRELPPATRILGALNAGYAGAALAACGTFVQTHESGWWLLAFGAVIAAAEIALLPREER